MAASETDKYGDDAEALRRLGATREKILSQLETVIVGQRQVIDELLLTIFAGGHALLVGVPGLAKTLLVSSLAKCLSLKFHRIQFTPDLMPSDITGTEVIQDDPATGHRRFKFLRGPVFANVILADEINRTPPKTQAALLEAMQERQVSVGGEDYKLAEPFFVLATQNPIEQEGTYPLPEAQLDRFLLNILVDYPSADEELDIMRLATGPDVGEPREVLSGEAIVELAGLVRRIAVAEHVFLYARGIVRASRPGGETAPDFVKRYVRWGCGPRASLGLILAGKARAALRGRPCVDIDDINAVAPPVMRHRLILNFEAQSEDLTTDDIIARLVENQGALRHA
ncbi:MAG: AAA family ATPase [Planctomycetes bacterium]|nr:AAA family ATPase [Planctomycetota bacterium]